MTVRGYNLAVIGSGGAGFAAAIAARDRGASVVVIERGEIGGTCVNTGCIPSKALLAGVAGAAGRPDLTALLGVKDELVAALRKAKYTDLAAEYGWDMRAGTARFVPGPMLRIEPAGEVIEADHYVIATGSAPAVPPIDGLRASGHLTSTTAMELDRPPESLIVIGGNAVGLEMAQLFARLGSEVVVLEARDRIAPFEEPEVSAAIEDALSGEGIVFHAGVTIDSVRPHGAGHTVGTDRGELYAERLLVATGRRPVTGGLGLDATGVEVGEHDEVMVGEHLRTTHPRIWAAGDVTGGPQYVYLAAAQGGLAAANALDGTLGTLDLRTLPRVTFTSPGVASVGLTEAQAVREGIDAESRSLPLENVPRAVVSRDTRGVIKLVAEAGTGRLFGAHVVAESAGEVIAAAGYAIAADMTVERIAGAWSPYLTMAEGLKLAAQAFTRDVSKLSCCAY